MENVVCQWGYTWDAPNTIRGDMDTGQRHFGENYAQELADKAGALADLPELAWRFTGTVEFYWDWYWHYNAVLMPIALAAMLDALGDRRTGHATAWWRRDAPLPVRRIRVTAVAARNAVKGHP